MPPPSDATWSNRRDSLLVRRAHEPPRSKAVVFDLDDTLLRWTCSGFPSKLDHYALWNENVLKVLRSLHGDGHKIVILSNQSVIKGAFDGKTADRVRSVVNWLASQCAVPLHGLFATRKNEYRKPEAALWTAMEEEVNGGERIDVTLSLYVGDMAGRPQDKGSSDRDFARNVSSARGATLQFRAPDEAFGPPSGGAAAFEAEAGPPDGALRTRRALLGGYAHRPVLLMLCGPQGAGKSFFCSTLLREASTSWVHISQDTISNGKPGKREACEKAAREALKANKSVVIDRMHLTPEQRAYFVAVARECHVPAHVLVMHVSTAVLQKRVRERTEHVGGVQGEAGARTAVQSAAKLKLPAYAEGFDLISHTHTEPDVARASSLYARLQPPKNAVFASAPSQPPLPPASFALRGDGVGPLPAIALGTMELRGAALAEMLRAGFAAVDTAPTYKNESAVASNLQQGAYLICKVPRRATSAQTVSDELALSLRKLGVRKCQLLLLHWPDTSIEKGTLGEVWGAMEAARNAGQCEALGVTNFTVAALQTLLPLCTTWPAVNQVERHPLCPQWELLEYCAANHIVLQAHSPLGNGKALLLQHDVVTQVACESGLTPAGVLLRWNLAHGVAIAPKCSSARHAADVLGAASGTLAANHMAVLDSIDTRYRVVNPPFMTRPGPNGARYGW